MSAHPPSSPRIQRQVVVSACFGTFLEWYDFLTFASLATWFGSLFFPATDPVAALLASLGTFGIGMIVRPLGAAPLLVVHDEVVVEVPEEGPKEALALTTAAMNEACELAPRLETAGSVARTSYAEGK